ncbi:hypothetical protein Drorol1_Dr00003657 [Drosera rotundifolia]
MMYKKKRNVASGDVPDFGAIFMSNAVTKKECFRKKLFGLPASMANFVKQVKAGMVLFLFEYESRALYGVYQACTDGGMELSPDAYKSSSYGFPAQVRYEVIWFCRPLSENEFGPVIKNNYFTPKKFNFGLSEYQVRELLVLFSRRKFRDDRPPNRALRSEGPTDAIEDDMYEDDDEVHESDDLMEDHIMVEDVEYPLLKKIGGSSRLIKFPKQTAAQLKSGGRPRLVNRAVDGGGLLMDDPTCPTATYKDFSVDKDNMYEFCDTVDKCLAVENAINPLFYSGYPESSISKRRRAGDNGLYGFAPEVVRDGAAIMTSGIGVGGRVLTGDAGCNLFSFSHADDPNMYTRYPRNMSSRMQLEGGLVGADSAVYIDGVDGRGQFVVQDVPLARSLDVPQPLDGTRVKMNLTHDEYQGRIDTNVNDTKGLDHAHSDVSDMDSDDAGPYDHGSCSHLVHATGTSHGQNVVDASQDSLLAGLPLSPRRSQLPFRSDVDVGGYSHKTPGYSRNDILQGCPSAGYFEGDNRGLYQNNNFKSVSALLARKLPAQAMRGRGVNRGLPSHGMSRIQGSSLPNDMYPMMKANNSHRMESSIGDADDACFKQGFALKSQSRGHQAPLLEAKASKSPKRTSVFARLNFSDVHGQRDNSQATPGDNGMENIVDEMMEMLTVHHERIKGSKFTTSENQGKNMSGLGGSLQSQGLSTFPVARKLNVDDTTQGTSLETRKAGPVNLKNQTEVGEKHEKSDVEASQKGTTPKIQRQRKMLDRRNFNSKKSDVESEELGGLSTAAENVGVGSGNEEAENVKDQDKCMNIEKAEVPATNTVESLHHKPLESVMCETLTCAERAQVLPNSDDIGLPSCTDKNENEEKSSAFVNGPSEINDDADPDNHEKSALSGNILGDRFLEGTDFHTDLGAETSEPSNPLLEGLRNDEE